MTSRVLRLLAGFFLAFTITQAQAEAPRFATGFLIYKSVPSDTPVYYNALLYISSSPLGIWREYDIGQSRPLQVPNIQVVSEIRFGALFSADFTSEAHVEYCKDIQAQLAAAAAESPKVKKAAQFASDAIQAEITRYTTGEVRYDGKWIPRAAYQSVIDEAERRKISAMHQETERQEEMRKVRQAEVAEHARREAVKARLKAQSEAEAAQQRLLRENIRFDYSSQAARLLAESYEDFVEDAARGAQAGRFFVIPGIHSDPQSVPMPRHPYFSVELHTDLKGSFSKVAMLCAFDKKSRLVAASVAFGFVTDSTKQTLMNKPEVEEARSILSKFDAQLFDMMPDILAVSRLGQLLPKLTAETSTLSIPLPSCGTTFVVGGMSGHAVNQFKQFVCVRLVPSH